MSEMNNLDFETKSRIAVDEAVTNNARVKVFGVGGAGGNTVNRMVKMEIEGVEYFAVNTDAKALELSLADHKIQIGQKLTKALGAGMKPEVGRKAAEENMEELRDAMQGADLVFITAGMGGGTGTGAAPVVGKIARELGILTVAVVSKPFGYEGKRRSTLAAEGIKELRSSVDTMIVVDNQKLLALVQNTDKTLTLDGSLRLADEVLGNAVRSICDIMFRHGLIHVDFADIKTVMTNGGSALMGTGIAEGEGRGIKAVDMALSSPLLEDINVNGATGVLVNVSHGENFSMIEYSEAMEHIHEAVSDANDPNIIIGDILLPELGDKVYITIIATGCGGSTINKAQEQAEAIERLRKAAMAASAIQAPAQTVVQPATAQTIIQPTPVQVAPVQPVQMMAQPMAQPAVAARPVPATPRPTDMNFVALAHATQPLPRVFPDANTVEMPTVAAASFDSCYSQSSFDATRSAEEELVLSPVPTMTATAVEEEVPSASEVDPLGATGVLSTAGLQEPAYTRTMARMEAQAKETARTAEVDPLKDSSVDYSIPAWRRMNMNSDAF